MAQQPFSVHCQVSEQVVKIPRSHAGGVEEGIQRAFVMHHGPPFILPECPTAVSVDILKKHPEQLVFLSMFDHQVGLELLLFGLCRGLKRIAADNRRQDCKHRPVSDDHEPDEQHLPEGCLCDRRGDIGFAIHQPEQRKQGMHHRAESFLHILRNLVFGP